MSRILGLPPVAVFLCSLLAAPQAMAAAPVVVLQAVVGQEPTDVEFGQTIASGVGGVEPVAGRPLVAGRTTPAFLLAASEEATAARLRLGEACRLVTSQPRVAVSQLREALEVLTRASPPEPASRHVTHRDDPVLRGYLCLVTATAHWLGAQDQATTAAAETLLRHYPDLATGDGRIAAEIDPALLPDETLAMARYRLGSPLGRLRVTAPVPHEVLVDGVPIGWTPLDRPWHVGRYRVWVERERQAGLPRIVDVGTAPVRWSDVARTAPVKSDPVPHLRYPTQASRNDRARSHAAEMARILEVPAALVWWQVPGRLVLAVGRADGSTDVAEALPDEVTAAAARLLSGGHPEFVADLQRPATGRVPLVLDSATVPVDVRVSRVSLDDRERPSPRATATCTTPCTLHVPPGDVELVATSAGRLPYRVTVPVTDFGTAVRLRVATSWRQPVGQGLTALGVAGLLGTAIVARALDDGGRAAAHIYGEPTSSEPSRPGVAMAAVAVGCGVAVAGGLLLWLLDQPSAEVEPASPPERKLAWTLAPRPDGGLVLLTTPF